MSMVNYVGQQFYNYAIIRLLKQGTFADVYEGEHIHLGIKAALKAFHNRPGNNDLQQFYSQVRTLAHLIHPHIIRTLDFGIHHNSIPFLIMDYAPGGTLRTLHPEGASLSLESIVAYVKQIASALLYAHDKQIVHCYVKPENMLLSPCKEILLGDFNFSALPRNSDDPSKEVQKVAYMAPEQLQGSPQPASDQYALGIVVYEWLCGRLPFQGSAFEISMQHLAAPPARLRDTVPTLSSALENVVLKALAKDPLQRFPNVQEFARALEQAYLLTLPHVSIFPLHSLGHESQHPSLPKGEEAMPASMAHPDSDTKASMQLPSSIRYEQERKMLSMQGQMLSLTQVTSRQLMPAASPSTPDPYAQLTEREIEVLHLLAGGLTNAQIAEKLIVSPRTVHAHVRSIYSKLGVTSRSAATRYAIQHQIA
jgi:serine/threonine protein kinase